MSRVLLDTHALVWLLADDARLGRKSGRIADSALARGELLVSALTFWEVAALIRRGRLKLDGSAAAWRRRVLAMGLIEIATSGEIAISADAFGDFPADPIDRFIAASAMIADALLITADSAILRWGGTLDRHDAQR